MITIIFFYNRSDFQNRYLKSEQKKQYKTKSIFLFSKKFKKLFYFFTCILPDYLSHEINKEL